jgi:hypothetical protein
MKVTSAGIIRNEDQPRVGVVSQHSLNSWFFDQLYDGSAIDLTYEETCEETRADILREFADKNDGIFETDDLDLELERRMEHYYPDSSSYLLGAWVAVDPGSIAYKQGQRYEIDRSGKSGDYAATYSTDGGNVCVEWSKHTKRTHHTSPCYVMADGSGPCGDLDTPGDSVVAYTLPEDCFGND